MKKLLCLMTCMLLLRTIKAQNYKVEPYYIGDRVSDLTLNPLLNYKDTTAKLSSFGHKLIILDFWDPRCSECIAMLPIEDSLQRLFAKDIQFILITDNPINDLQEFIEGWEKNNHQHFSLPIMARAYRVSFRKIFLQKHLPHYVWLAPNGTLLAQTNSVSIDTAIIKAMIQNVQTKEKMYKSRNMPEDIFHFPPVTDFQEQVIKFHL